MYIYYRANLWTESSLYKEKWFLLEIIIEVVILLYGRKMFSLKYQADMNLVMYSYQLTQIQKGLITQDEIDQMIFELENNCGKKN
jgi:hypothetical protein